MPRVTDEHRVWRRQQILDAAWRCFVREGFHQTSMADILAESDLSAGTVYRYFTGKGELIAAIVERVMERVAELLEPIVSQDPPPRLDEALQQALTATSELAFGENGFAWLAPQVWAEAQRNSTLAELVRSRYRMVIGMLSRLVVAEQKAGRVAAEGDPDEVAKVLFGTILGYILQRLLVGDVDPDSYASGLSGLARPDVSR